MDDQYPHLPTIAHMGFLEPLTEIPPSLLLSRHIYGQRHHGHFSCAYCGVGDSAYIEAHQAPLPPAEEGTFRFQYGHTKVELRARLSRGYLQLITDTALVPAGSVLEGIFKGPSGLRSLRLTAFDELMDPTEQMMAQRFLLHPTQAQATHWSFRDPVPTSGCVKFRTALGEEPGLLPIHTAPSVLDITGRRVSLFYEEALERFAHLLLEHRAPHARTLVYASGQVDYFAQFAMQEVFRLLGVRNLGGNHEHGYASGALYREFLTGQEGPFLTLAQAVNGPNRLFILNGWNGFITHPPVFNALMQRDDLDAYLIDVMVTESARMLSSKLGRDRILLIRSGGDGYLAMAIAHEILQRWPGAVSDTFLHHFADRASFEAFAQLARSDTFAPEDVADRIAPESPYERRILRAIRDIAFKLVQTSTVPIHLPSVGLSQTRGIVPHCLWGNILGLLGKFGLHPDGTPAGGTLQLPGQSNEATSIQALSPQHFFGRLPMTEAGAAEAALRLGLGPDAYQKALESTPRMALEYSEPNPKKELFVFFGTQFERMIMNRPRWLRKLQDPLVKFIVIDPVPDAFSLKHAALIIPTAPPATAARLTLNGEWRFSLSLPRRRSPRQVRSDVTLIYDVMETISQSLKASPSLAIRHPDLAQLNQSGYLPERFVSPELGGGLCRQEGEVNRPLLWERIHSYLGGGQPLYCRPEHADGRPITWEELLLQGSVLSGGVGVSRQVLSAMAAPFQDIYRRPTRFHFFTPTKNDLSFPSGLVLNSGRSQLSTEPARTVYALSTFNSGKSASGADMPEDNPLFISMSLAERMDLKAGDRVWVTNLETRTAMVLSVQPTSLLLGETIYISMHKSRVELAQSRHVNNLTGHSGRCPYTGQTTLKLTQVRLEKAESPLR